MIKFKAIEDLDLQQAEPFRRPLFKSAVHTARAVLHEVPSRMIIPESDLIPISGNTGTKISCTVSAFKKALGISRPGVMITLFINARDEGHPLNLTMDLHQVTEELEIIPHRGV